MQQSKPEEFAIIQQRASDYWNSVPNQNDKNMIKQSFVPITVIGNKYDVFAQSCEPKMKKIFCAALRYISHASGADLVFSSIKETNPLKLYKNMVGYHTFKTIVS